MRYTRFLRSAVLLVALALVAADVAAAGESRALAVEAVGFTVSDVDRSARFFRDVLGFETVSDVEVSGPQHERLQGVFGLRMRVVRLRLGREVLELTGYLAPEGRPLPVDSRSNDRWFQHVAIVTHDMDAAYRHLREHGVRHASPGPQRLPDWNPSAGGIEAFYFKDPDGHALEIIRFPAGKGDARWQRADGGLFLGIDHTAIVVGDTDASLRLYRDLLGLRIAGRSENWGEEQERLNNVFGARLRITALRAAAGPGIELLEYLAPGDGRPYPADSRANDLWHWQTHLGVQNAAAAATALRDAGYAWISPGAVVFDRAPVEPALAFARGGAFAAAMPADGAPTRSPSAAALVRDPDGHALLLVERRP